MSHPLTLLINPESFNFLNPYKNKVLSYTQRSFLEIVTETYKKLSQLKKQEFFEFTAENEAELSRGNFYAITPSLQKKFPQKINLENLQAILENDLHIDNKETLSFIVLCLVEPVWLPGSLSAMACSVLAMRYLCIQPPHLEAKLLKNAVCFQLNFDIKTIYDEPAHDRGKIILQFTINNRRQVKLLPIQMHFNFPNAEESIEFQQKLTKDFQTWILHQDELTKIHTQLAQASLLNSQLCLIPIIFSLLISLIMMISFIVLSLSMTSLLILPPLNLALGLGLACLAYSGAYLDRKKEEKKLQRPIYLFNKKKLIAQTQTMQTTSFFAHPRLSPTMAENRWAHQP